MKLLEKIRRWLIKKLGGYTCPISLPPTRTYTMRPVKVEANRIVTRWGIPGNTVPEDYINGVKELLVEDLVKALQGGSFIRFERWDMGYEIHFRASMFAITDDQRQEANL